MFCQCQWAAVFCQWQWHHFEPAGTTETGGMGAEMSCCSDVSSSARDSPPVGTALGRMGAPDEVTTRRRRVVLIVGCCGAVGSGPGGYKHRRVAMAPPGDPAVSAPRRQPRVPSRVCWSRLPGGRVYPLLGPVRRSSALHAVRHMKLFRD